jgi:hypothetical protein
MAEKKNIYEKLAEVRKAVEVVQKDSTGYGYNYVSDRELLALISGTMETNHLTLIPRITPGTTKVEPWTYIKNKLHPKTKELYDEVNNEVIVSAEMTYTWVNNDDPNETVEVPWMLVGQQSDASQSFGAALTYSYRYFLLKYFGVATVEDDPDNWRSRQKEAEKEQDRLVTKEIIEEFDKLLREYLDANPGKKTEVVALISKYATGGKYKSIAEPALAAKLLKDFKNTFMESKEE